MPKSKQKVKNAVRKLKEDVAHARIPTMQAHDPGLSAYRAVREGDEDSYADTPGGREDGAAISARDYGDGGGYGAVGGRMHEGARAGEDDAVSMDPSLASPARLAFTGAFERAIADPALAGVDFLVEEPAARSQAHQQLSAVSEVPFSPWEASRNGASGTRAAWGKPVNGHRREDDDDEAEMALHEPARKWGDFERGTEADADNDGDGLFFERGGLDDDGVELLNLRQPSDGSSGAHGRGGGHGMSRGKVTNLRAFTHILKSYIGSGVLGLPYAYAQGGMIAAMTGMVTVSVMSTLCVFMLLDCKRKLPGRVRTFGDVGYGAMGRSGHVIVELTVVLSQLGFSCAYLIFVSQNLFLYVKLALTSEASIVWTLVPILVALSWIPSLDILAPFAVLALALIFGGLGAVAWHAAPLVGSGPDVQSYIPSTLPIFIGMAIYAFEGIGLALPIENQMLHPESFKMVWTCGMLVVTATYIGFGAFCYSCYGDEVASVLPPCALAFQWPRVLACSCACVPACLRACVRVCVRGHASAESHACGKSRACVCAARQLINPNPLPRCPAVARSGAQGAIDHHNGAARRRVFAAGQARPFNRPHLHLPHCHVSCF